MTNPTPTHLASSWLAHTVAALSVAAILLLGSLRLDVPAVGPGQERGVRELATLLGTSRPAIDQIELNVRSWSRFPPAAEAGRMLAAALAGCPMTDRPDIDRPDVDRPDVERLDLAGRIYAITNGRELSDAQVSSTLDAFRRAATAARCEPAPTRDLVDAIRAAARTDPRPRPNWW